MPLNHLFTYSACRINNYGGVLIVFDRLFSTYKAERDDLPCRYGLVKPVTSYNPLRIELTQWATVIRDVVTAKSLRAVIGYVVMPPGWQPDGEGETTEDSRHRVDANAEPVRALEAARQASPAYGD